MKKTNKKEGRRRIRKKEEEEEEEEEVNNGTNQSDCRVDLARFAGGHRGTGPFAEAARSHTPASKVIRFI